jgi:C-terminal processing protease CtpA/Prc
VLPHSPAAEAGLEERDEIVSVDGKKVALQQLRSMFGEPGKRYTVRVRRGGREFDATLVTRRLV